jgi:starch synthase (maltosyl-transferring)
MFRLPGQAADHDLVTSVTEREAPPRIQIENPQPRVDCGRHPAKACVGDVVGIEADVFRDGHDVLRAVLRWRAPDGKASGEAPMEHVDAHHNGVHWAGSFPVDAQGRWEVTVEAWADALASWRDEVRRKLDAGQEDLAGELSEGVLLLREAVGRASEEDRVTIERALAVAADETAPGHTRAEAALTPAVAAAADRHPDRSRSSTLAEPLAVEVARLRARFGAWYELFPRSWGGFRGVRAQLPRLAELGFDVLYLPPIHPIGRTNRKGRNNALVAGPGDPGSPWAIGGPEGGHTAIHPDLGTIDDFDDLVAAARAVGIEVALDFAIQCSADHPWLTEHPEWFHRRPDGTLKYAENPPKKYQDIYNVNWDSDDWEGLWRALLEVVRHWVHHGVRVFRVDNPHTKPLPFWEWLIAAVRAEEPDVIFLAEAFTRRPMMRALGKLGFDQSYTYFTWRNARWELEQYLTELSTTDERLYFRPNFFANTPDILTEELAVGGPAKFYSRLVLAATLSPSYGIYSGFEHFENVPVRRGSEEYLDSEKYEVRRRRLDGPLLPYVQRLNDARRANPALQRLEPITFLDTENDALVAYAKRSGTNVVITVVTLDPHVAQEGAVHVPYELGLRPVFSVVDELQPGSWHQWRLGRNYVRLEPGERGAHLLRVLAP